MNPTLNFLTDAQSLALRDASKLLKYYMQGSWAVAAPTLSDRPGTVTRKKDKANIERKLFRIHNSPYPGHGTWRTLETPSEKKSDAVSPANRSDLICSRPRPRAAPQHRGWHKLLQGTFEHHKGCWKTNLPSTGQERCFKPLFTANAIDTTWLAFNYYCQLSTDNNMELSKHGSGKQLLLLLLLLWKRVGATQSY